MVHTLRFGKSTKVAHGRTRVKGVNVGNCAILENYNDFIEFVCSDIELNCFKYGHMKMCHMKS